MRKSLVAASFAAVVLFAVTVGLLLSSQLPKGWGADQYSVTVGAGLSPRLAAADAAALATERISDMASKAGKTVVPNIVSVSALRFEDVGTVVPNWGGGNDGDPSRITWIVKARGWFVSELAPPGLEPVEGPAGYLEIDDATGFIMGMGIGSQFAGD